MGGRKAAAAGPAAIDALRHCADRALDKSSRKVNKLHLGDDWRSRRGERNQARATAEPHHRRRAGGLEETENLFRSISDVFRV